MTTFAQWLADVRWAMNMMRARAWRRNLLFSRRREFDLNLRPRIRGEPGNVIDYPDAIYHIGVDDLARAMVRSKIGAIGDPT